MNPESWRSWVVFMGLVAGWAGSGECGVVLDGTLGTSGSLTGPDYEITQELGQSVGENLFHSFDTFNIDTGESAIFSGAASIENVIARVTGGESSWIDGTIGSTIEGADLWLINPWGVVFGEHARLDLGGSFYVSTADYLKLGEGGSFAATVPAESVLVSAAPEAFGFLDDTIAGITATGALLQVDSGETLALVGGELSLHDGGSLFAQGGEVSLVAVATAGEVVRLETGFDVSGFSTLGNISIACDGLSNFYTYADDTLATLDVSDYDAATGAGTIFIRGGNIILDGAGLRARNFGDTDSQTIGIDLAAVNLSLIWGGSLFTYSGMAGSGGGIVIVLTDELSIDGSSQIMTLSEGTGDNGAIDITAGSIALTNAGSIVANTQGAGDGGDINLTVAGNLLVQGAESYSASLISTEANGSTADAGDAGSLVITADSISLVDGGKLSVSTNGFGAGGDIVLNVAGELVVQGEGGYGLNSYIFAVTTEETSGAGAGGDIVVSAGSISLLDGGGMAAYTSGTGSGGSIELTVEGTLLIQGEQESDGISSQLNAGAYGDMDDAGSGGSVVIEAADLFLLDGGFISAGTTGFGMGGDITLTVDGGVVVQGDASDGDPSSITANTSGEVSGAGRGGNITIRAGELLVLDGGWIGANTYGYGEGGEIYLEVAGAVVVQGETSQGTYSSQINAGSVGDLEGAGSGGGVTMVAGSLSLLDGGWIGVNTWGTGTGGDLSVTVSGEVLIQGSNSLNHSSNLSANTYGEMANAGVGGSIVLNAANLSLLDGVWIGAGTWGTGSGGDILLNVTGAVVVAGEDSQGVYSSQIYAGSFGDMVDAGTGGTITVIANTLSLLDGGWIGALSDSANGGDIIITVTDSLIMEHGSITTSVAGGTGSGGNITIDPEFVVLYQSEIIANAMEGSGGNITIVADNFIADPSSVISASSELGVDGNIEIDSPNVDVSGGLLVLANQGLDVENTLAAKCANRRTFGDEEPSSFKLVSGGGVAISGGELLPAWAVGSVSGAPGMTGVHSNGVNQLPEECWQLTRLESESP